MVTVTVPHLTNDKTRHKGGFPGGSVVKKNPLAHAGDKRDTGLTPGRGDPLQKDMATHSSILAWKIQWTEEPGELEFMESQSRTQLSMST